MRLWGIIPPLLTTFNEEGEFDAGRLGRLVEFLKPHVQGFFVCGTYGSGPLMDVQERKRVLETVASQAAGSHQLVAHVGAASQRDALELSEHAAQHGAQAVSAVAPFYYRHDEETLFQFYRDLIKACPLPVYVYDNPGTTGNPVSATLLKRLAEIGLHGLKDSSFDISKLYAAMRMVESPDFDVVIGSESLLLPAFVMGARACIAGLANVLPELVGRLHDAARRGDLAAAAGLQTQVLKMWDILHYGASIPTALAMLQVRGIDAGLPRRPILPLADGSVSRVRAAMDATRGIWS